MNLAIWLERAAKIWPDAPALLVGTELVADYAQFAARVASIAAGLCQRFGITPGARVAIFMPNRIEYLEVMYAAWHAGAAVVPINAKLHVKEVSWMIENSDSKVVICAHKMAKDLAALIDTARTAVIDIDSDDFSALYREAPMPCPASRGSDDLAWLFYTSGTTGRPKGVMLTHGNLAAMTFSYFVDVDTVEGEDAMIYAAPISHGAGLYNFMFVLRGARHVVPASGGFDGDEIAILAQQLDNACIFAAPTMVRRMVSSAKQTGYRGTGLKTVVYGGGPMYLADILEAVDVLGPCFAQIYGQGESPMTITALSKDLVADRQHPQWRERLASVGKAHSCIEIMVADENGRACDVGQVGEILVRGTTVMHGYWRNDEATHETLKDGWLWTGDMGILDADGFLTLQDRSKDVIISGGTNIYPREVEETLLTHPAVAQAAVIGQSDPEWGEVVIAYVVPEEGAACDDQILDDHCVTNIARFKRPKRYIYANDLPKNAYGKVLKNELRSMLENENA